MQKENDSQSTKANLIMMQFLEEITLTKRYLPTWIRQKAKWLLEGRFVDLEDLMDRSFNYFQVDMRIFKSKKRKDSDIKHLIRYALYIYGIPYEDIGEYTNSDRTNIYHSIEFVENVTSVDKDYKKDLDDFLEYLKKD
jgi:hypothetical protein